MNAINAVPNAPNTGRMALRSVPNKQMADRFGLAPMPNMVVEGDPSQLDYQKVSKYMKSGAKRVAGEFVERQTTWPEKCLAPSAPGYNKSTHAQLTLPELIEGMIAKTLMETPSAALNPELANRFSYIKELIVMSYTLDLQHVLAINFRFLSAWENHNHDWDNWDRIKLFLQEARFQELISSVAHHRPQSHRNGAGRFNSAPPSGESNVRGVPTQVLKDNNLCIKFNKGSCKEKGKSHKHPFETDRTLFHQCAACLHKAAKTDDTHGASDDKCTNKIFRKQ